MHIGKSATVSKKNGTSPKSSTSGWPGTCTATPQWNPPLYCSVDPPPHHIAPGQSSPPGLQVAVAPVAKAAARTEQQLSMNSTAGAKQLLTQHGQMYTFAEFGTAQYERALQLASRSTAPVPSRYSAVSTAVEFCSQPPWMAHTLPSSQLEGPATVPISTPLAHIIDVPRHQLQPTAAHHWGQWGRGR